MFCPHSDWMLSLHCRAPRDKKKKKETDKYLYSLEKTVNNKFEIY